MAHSSGYSPKTADQQASRLLTNIKVQDAVRKQRDKTRARDWHQPSAAPALPRHSGLSEPGQDCGGSYGAF
ncbi:hypothetical protein C4901_09035 [Acidiferrobacter sp. SPIII_3]|uniref:terminase small subunit n=1 Tax=Acidiferrobacter sp. SPIII_3 TaxID=1281578 RepID=UPI000D730FA9|nr:hypothetical protein C4901_09035 [Acidiferrobacter sp. SPIII_3]